VVEQWSKIAPPGWGPEGGSWPPAAAWGIGAGPGDAMAADPCAAGRTLTAGAFSGGGIRTAATGEQPFRREQQGAPAAALASGGERSPRKSCRHEQQHENRGQRCPKDPWPSRSPWKCRGSPSTPTPGSRLASPIARDGAGLWGCDAEGASADPSLRPSKPVPACRTIAVVSCRFPPGEGSR
jgi:hypothetical protein